MPVLKSKQPAKCPAPTRPLETLIHLIRGQMVILDADLAALYDVSTGALNQAVRRNLGRFPADFMFRLTSAESENLKSQSVTSSWGRPRPVASMHSRKKAWRCYRPS